MLVAVYQLFISFLSSLLKQEKCDVPVAAQRDINSSSGFCAQCGHRAEAL